MSEHQSTVLWQRDGAAFVDNRYSRAHTWRFDGGISLPASASPHVVPLPLSVAAAVDPEEAFVASLSSCHMLWFLSIAAKDRWVVDSYRDDAVGLMARDGSGELAMVRVTLRPATSFGGERRPDQAQLHALHERAHRACFLARSVRCELRCEPLDSPLDTP